MAAEAAAASAVEPSAKRVPAQRHGWLCALSGDKTGAECRLYDRPSHGVSVPGVLLVVLPSATFAYLRGEAIALWIVLSDARRPPLAR